jgi:hypothetical protein
VRRGLDGKMATASRPIYRKAGKLKDGVTERLAGVRAGMNGHAASHHDNSVTDGEAPAGLCRGDSALLPLATPDSGTSASWPIRSSVVGFVFLLPRTQKVIQNKVCYPAAQALTGSQVKAEMLSTEDTT